MSATQGSAAPYLVGGPLRPNWWQSLLTAAVIGVVAFAYAVVLPAYALSVSQLSVPVGAVHVGRVSLVPEPGWEVVENSADAAESVTLVKDGVTLSLREAAVTGSEEEQADRIIDDAVEADPSIKEVSESFQVVTPSDDPGVIVYLTGPQQAVVVAVVSSESVGVAGEVLAVGQSAVVSELSGEIETMVASIRIRRGGPS